MAMRPVKRRKRRMLQIAVVLFFGFVALFGTALLIAINAFSGEDHSAFDAPPPKTMGTREKESPEHAAIAQEIRNGVANPPSGTRQQQLAAMRKYLNDRGAAATINSEIREVDVNGISAEWVIAPNASPTRRLLYLHGGGYVAGSPKSHRPITSRFSEVANAAVLCIDYRLMPEYSRMAGIEDSRTAYRWIVENGPSGPSQAEVLIVAGDSSGGNLALSTVAWARDQQLRRADAAVVLCPQTDATLASPSLRTNIETDIMQGPSFGPVVNAPRAISLWIVYLMHRINPSSPLISPLLGDLSNLPPTLLQVSESEMFLDDSVRYANKASAQGSVAIVQSWPSLIHVWHAFEVPESDEAFERIGGFVSEYAK